MVYINKITKYLYFSRPLWLEESQVLAATDMIITNKNAIIYYKDKFLDWFESPIILHGEEYEVYKSSNIPFPILYKDGVIFQQLLQGIYFFYKEKSSRIPAEAGICELE